MVKKKAKKEKQQAPKEEPKEPVKDQPKPTEPVERPKEEPKTEQPASQPAQQEPGKEALVIQVPGFNETDIKMLECTCTVCQSKMMWPVPKTIGQSVMYITGCKSCGGM